MSKTERVQPATAAALGDEDVIPFVDLTFSTESVRRDVWAGLEGILDGNAFINGPQVAAFEREFAEWCGVAHCVGLASGLDALRLGLLAADAGPGDEVIVPALTFIATFEAVTQIGATPVVVDVQRERLQPRRRRGRRGSERSHALPPARSSLRPDGGHASAAGARESRRCSSSRMPVRRTVPSGTG